MINENLLKKYEKILSFFYPKTHVYSHYALFSSLYVYFLIIKSFFLKSVEIKSQINNFYLGDQVSRNSFAMLNASKKLLLSNAYVYIFFFYFNLWVY